MTMNTFGLLVAIIALVSAVSGVPFVNNVESNELEQVAEYAEAISIAEISDILEIKYFPHGGVFVSKLQTRLLLHLESDFASSLNKCAFQADSDGIASCAAERIVRSLNKLSSQPTVELLPGVSVLSDERALSFRSGKQLMDEIEKAKSNHGSMLELVGNAVVRFFEGRTLKVKLPSSDDIGRALQEERKRRGGHKNKGNMNMGMWGIGAAIAGLVPLFVGKIALITLAALVIGKVALVLGAVLLVQMFMRGSNNHAAETSWSPAAQVSHGSPSNSYGPPSASYGVPSSQYPYHRSFNVEDAQPTYSQELAYSAQRK